MAQQVMLRLCTSALPALIVTVLLGCQHCGTRRSVGVAAEAKRLPVRGLGPEKLRLDAPARDAHRIVLDPPALARLRDAARLNTVAFRRVTARCDEALARPLKSGYQAFEWSDALAALALAWHATGDDRYAEGAVRYLRALLDDRFIVGDGKGGADVVTHDSGYGVRTFGAYSALGYDWLREAPGMDAALRKHVLERLDQWLRWYATSGYLRDRATANYYWGYLTTLAFAGLAASGESEAADGWLRRARDELSTRILPTFRDDLGGGGWPEGGQYGEYTTLEVALVAEAFRTGLGLDVAGKLPWLADTIPFHVHALLPDGRSVYDGGTWGEHPAKPSALAVSAASIALEGVNDERVAEARWMIAHALPPLLHEQAWVGLLAERPGAAERPPRAGSPTSLHANGQGLTFVRSDWSPSAVWASFQAGPRLAEDHQDADQGHFELWRGADGLLVDGGDAEGSATINHNTLLVDDGGRHLDYPPNQGVWGHAVRTTRFGDDGVVAVAVGDIGEAYAPSCVREGCSDRSVSSLVRTFVYVRPGLLVIDDRVALERGGFGVTWAAHLTTNPIIRNDLASAVVGNSRVDVRTLEPREAGHAALREPTPSGEGSHRANRPWGPMWRLEVRSPVGLAERGFLHVVTAAEANAFPPPSRGVQGEGLRGAIVSAAGRRTAVLFADEKGEGRVALGGEGADLAVVVGLAPGERYRISVDPAGCMVRLARSPDERAPSATPGGFLRIGPLSCGGP